MSKFYTVIGILVISPVFLLGSFFLLKGLRNVQMSLASVKWPKAPGMVVSSATTRSGAMKDTTLRPMGEGPRSPSYATFGTKTTIRYTVGGREYTTDQIHFGQTLGSSDRSDAELLALRFPEGKQVPVSYNPGNPSIGVMNPGLHSEAFWLPSAGLVFLLPVAVLVLVWPLMFGGLTKKDDRSFENYVKQSMSAMQRAADSGERVTLPEPPPRPSGSSDDKIMGIIASGFCAIFLGIGVLLLTLGLQRAWNGFASRSWPTAPGVVVWGFKGGGQNGEDLSDESGNEPDSRARFVYEYAVAGTKHYNNIRRFEAIGLGDQSETEEVAERYRKGARVTVSYYPVDPDVSTVEPGNTTDALILPVAGIVIILFMLAAFKWGIPAIAS